MASNMTQTTPSHSQAVEAAVGRLMILAWRLTHACEEGKSDADAFEAGKALQTALRAELSSQQEVAAPRMIGASTFDDVFLALDRAHELSGAPHERINALIDEREAASRVPVASLASREQGVEAVGAVPSRMPRLFNKPQKTHYPQCTDCTLAYQDMADDCGWVCDGKSASESERGMFIQRTAPPSSKTQDDPWTLTRDLVGVNTHPINTATTSELPKAPAPVPVVQGEPSAVAQFMGMRKTPKGTREFWGYVHGSNELTEGELLYRATPATEQATTGSGQDRRKVAEAIWDVMRKDTEDEDVELDDLTTGHSVWDYADAAILSGTVGRVE